MRTLVAATLALLLATQAMAQQTFIWFYGRATADLTESPIVFSGGMTPGGDMEAGSWEITVSDAGWPSDPAERLTFMWDTLFSPNYVRDFPSWGGAGWVADLCTSVPTSTADALEASWLPLHIQDDTNGGSLSGWCLVREFAYDDNLNGVLDSEEFPHGLLLMDTVLICEGNGVYDGLCGEGYAYGMFARAGLGPAEGEELWRFGMYLWLEDCMQGCDPPDLEPDVTGMPEAWDSTWGTIKAMYR